MKAVVQSRYGSADVLEPSNVQKPVMRDDEVLVRVRAASIGARVTHFTEGDPLIMRLAFGLRIITVVDRTYQLAHMADAIRSFRHDHGHGKTIVTI